MSEEGINVEKLDAILFGPADGNYYRIGDLVGKGFSIGRKPRD
jgi:hypothetical protein